MEEGSQTGHRIEGYLEKCGIIDTLRHALAEVGRCIYMNTEAPATISGVMFSPSPTA